MGLARKHRLSAWVLLAVAGVVAADFVRSATAHADRVAVFDDPVFVDTTSRNNAAEADNIQATLAWLGHRVVPVTSIEPLQLQSVLSGVNVFVIPELENRDLVPALSDASIEVIRNFVARGRTLIVHGTSDQRAPRLLNTLFAWRLTSGTVGTAIHGPDAAGTPFAGTPNRILANQRTRGLDLSSLPSEAAVFYINRTRTPVAQFPHQSGRVIYLGWDWYQAAPLGRRDGGWLAVLAAAIGGARQCEGNDGEDLDGDGIVDRCGNAEGCANVDGRRQIARGSWIEFDSPTERGFQKLFFNGTFRLPPGTRFSDLDPRATPFEFAVLARDGSPQISQSFPQDTARTTGGPGWHFSARDAKWVFEDSSGATANGFVRVVAKDLSNLSPGRVRFRAIGENGLYPINPSGVPFSVRIVVGNARAGECAEARYSKDDCNVEKKERSLTCRF